MDDRSQLNAYGSLRILLWQARRSPHKGEALLYIVSALLVDYRYCVRLRTISSNSKIYVGDSRRYLGGREKAKSTLLIVHQMYIEYMLLLSSASLERKETNFQRRRRQLDQEEQRQSILAQFEQLLPQSVHQDRTRDQQSEVMGTRSITGRQILINSEGNLKATEHLGEPLSSPDQINIGQDRGLQASKMVFSINSPLVSKHSSCTLQPIIWC